MRRLSKSASNTGIRRSRHVKSCYLVNQLALQCTAGLQVSEKRFPQGIEILRFFRPNNKLPRGQSMGDGIQPGASLSRSTLWTGTPLGIRSICLELSL